MTISLSPEQEKAVRDAIRTGKVASVEEFIARAFAELPKGGGDTPNDGGQTVFEQGLGLFGSSEDAALLDDVVAIAYQERRRPSKREPVL